MILLATAAPLHLALPGAREACFLFAAALLGGAINSVAGGGGFLCFPALLFTGMPPIQANATNTIALWPGTVAATGAYRHEMHGTRRFMLPLIACGSIGALTGAKILLHTPQATFLRMVPWLLLAATALFAFSAPLAAAFRRLQRADRERHSGFALGISALIQLLISIYIGFFGAGAGILMLAMFAVLGIESIHTMNGMKTLLASICNGIALITFIVAGVVVWPQALLMTVGAAIGGFTGATYAQRLDQRYVRSFVVFIGLALSAYFFLKGA